VAKAISEKMRSEVSLKVEFGFILGCNCGGKSKQLKNSYHHPKG
jgi:hypothetical protein